MTLSPYTRWLAQCALHPRCCCVAGWDRQRTRCTGIEDSFEQGHALKLLQFILRGSSGSAVLKTCAYAMVPSNARQLVRSNPSPKRHLALAHFWLKRLPQCPSHACDAAIASASQDLYKLWSSVKKSKTKACSVKMDRLLAPPRGFASYIPTQMHVVHCAISSRVCISLIQTSVRAVGWIDLISRGGARSCWLCWHALCLHQKHQQA